MRKLHFVQPKIPIGADTTSARIAGQDATATECDLGEGEASAEIHTNEWPVGIRSLADKIFFVHARNVRGTAEHFVETWHDNGDIHIPSVIRELQGIGYTGTIRPDHAPSMAGETNETPGYEMLGRLFAAGYLRGLMQAGEPN